MSRLALSITATLLSCVNVLAQGNVPEKPAPTCGVVEIYKKDGWVIPGLLNAKVNPRGRFTNIPGVFITPIDPLTTETVLTKIGYSSEGGGRIYLEDAPIRILELRAWDYEGHIFAYSVLYELQVMNHSERRALGAATTVFFYDVDGSGVFTVRRHDKGVLGKIGIPDLPANIRKNSRTSVVPDDPVLDPK